MKGKVGKAGSLHSQNYIRPFCVSGSEWLRLWSGLWLWTWMRMLLWWRRGLLSMLVAEKAGTVAECGRKLYPHPHPWQPPSPATAPHYKEAVDK